MKITSGESYTAWFYELYYMASDYPNAKTEKLREPTYHELWSKEFKTKEEAEEFSNTHTIEDIFNLKEDWFEHKLRHAKRIAESDIEVKWRVREVEVTPLYF